MKLKAILGLALFSLIGMKSMADEGMWIPMLIGKNYEQMKKQGFKLTAQDLYNINKASMKDAIVWFNGGCTGEIVSKEGLLFTNHHCGYDAIASNSTPTDNILDNGWWAKSKAEEKPIKGMWVSVLQRMEDVTALVQGQLKGVPEKDRATKLMEINKAIRDSVIKDTKLDARVAEYYRGNAYYLLVFEKYTDIRLVGTPPQNVGKYGGDTDNWVWPRHTGDFSVFRVYTSKDNKPADYSADNVPMKPKHYLPVSLKGVNNNDFAMIYGFPGRTNRFETSMGIQLAIDQVNPTIVKLRDIRLTNWKVQMDKNVDHRLKLSAMYAQIANYWKYFIGQTEQMQRLKVYDAKVDMEAKFQTWAKGKAEYENLFATWKTAYEKYQPYAKHATYMNEGVLVATSWSRFVRSLESLEKALTANKTEDIKKAVEMLRTAYVDVKAQSFREPSDRKILAAVLANFYIDVPANQHPKVLSDMMAKYHNTNLEESAMQFVNYLYSSSMFVDAEKTEKFLNDPSLEALKKDAAYQLIMGFVRNYNENVVAKVTEFNVANNEFMRTYIKGMMEMNPGSNMYPDANSTIRITYGNVQNYAPRDGVTYNYFTTIEGVMEKYQPGDDEFDLPKNYVELFNKKDYGRYAWNGTLPVAFITNNDITGGNSGSPCINAKGELIGLAFDGNWEAMSGDIVFDKKYKRTIVVDVRYVLWCIEKLGGAPHIVGELDLK